MVAPVRGDWKVPGGSAARYNAVMNEKRRTIWRQILQRWEEAFDFATGVYFFQIATRAVAWWFRQTRLTKPRRRRWYQFRLKTLLIAVVLMSAALAWLTWQVRIVQGRKALVEALLRPSDRCWDSIKVRKKGWMTESGWSQGPNEQRRATIVRLGEAQKGPSDFRYCVLGDESISEITLGENGEPANDRSDRAKLPRSNGPKGRLIAGMLLPLYYNVGMARYIPIFGSPGAWRRGDCFASRCEC